MKEITTLIKDIWGTYSTGVRNREKTALGFVAVLVVSLSLIILGLIDR